MHRPSFTSHLDLFVALLQRRNPSLNYTRRQTVFLSVSGYWIDDDFILFYAIFRIKRRKNIFPRDDP